jgi:RNA polymerase sigma-70 factor, ECF subfamily
VFIHAFRKLDQFDIDRPFGPWVRGIAFNLLRNHWRKFRADAVGGHAELDLLVDHELSTSHTAGRESECLEVLPACLEELEAHSKEVLQLRYREEWSIRSLCERFNRRHSSMTMWLHRIREQVSQCIDRKTAGAGA